MAVINAILVRWTGGTTFVEDAASIAQYERREAVVKLPDITSAAQAQEVAQAILDARAQPRTRTSDGHLPTSTTAEPFTAYNLGDIVTAPGPDGSAADLRVQSVTVNEDADGNLEFSPELGACIDELEDALERYLAKYGSAPATENGSGAGGDSSAYGGGSSDPSVDYPPTEPEPVPATEPWVDPTINGGTQNNPTINDPAINDPTINGTAVINHVEVPPPDEGEDPSVGLEVGEGRTTVLNGPVEIGDALTLTRNGAVDIGEAVVYSRNASPANETLGLLWDGAKGLLGRLSGRKGGAGNTVAIDADGNWKFGYDDTEKPTVDFTQANVLGLGGGCIDTTTASDSGVYVDCTPGSTAANIVQFGRSGDVSTTGIPTKGGYLLGTGAAGGGSFELGANNSSSGNYCYVAGQAGSGYLDLYAEDFIQLFSNTSVIVFSQAHPSSSQFAWYFDYDGVDWYIVDNSNSANRWKISP